MSALTIGTFDLLHHGHINLLRRAQLLGQMGLRVGVNTDEFAASFKRQPVQSFRERADTLEALGYSVVRNDSAGRELIEFVRPQILIVGSDWARKDYCAQIDVTQDWLDEHNIILAYVPYTPGVSTTELIARIRDRGE